MANVVELKLFQEILSFGVQWGNSLLFVQSTLSYCSDKTIILIETIKVITMNIYLKDLLSFPNIFHTLETEPSTSNISCTLLSSFQKVTQTVMKAGASDGLMDICNSLQCAKC